MSGGCVRSASTLRALLVSFVIRIICSSGSPCRCAPVTFAQHGPTRSDRARPLVPRDSRYLLICKSISLRPCRVCSTLSSPECHFAAPLSRLFNIGRSRICMRPCCVCSTFFSRRPFRCAPVAFAQHWSIHYPYHMTDII